MIQRYDVHVGPDPYEMPNGEYVRYADIEPLLPKWVSVEERLPERPGMYLIATHAGTFDVDCFISHRREWDVYRLSEVTHWMPLPPLPTT